MPGTCIIGEREVVMGFKLIGINDTFIIDLPDGVAELRELFKSGNYNTIMASQSLQKYLQEDELNIYNTSMNPLVIFIPVPGIKEEESVYDLAKRILGIDIGD